MGPVALILAAFVVALAIELWLRRWPLTIAATTTCYLLLVSALQFTPFRDGGFPGWDFVLMIPLPIGVAGSVLGIFAARRVIAAAAKR